MGFVNPRRIKLRQLEKENRCSYFQGKIHGNQLHTSVLPAPVQQSFSYKLLSVPVPNMIHTIPAMRKEMPRNGGTTLRMRKI